tara:strand:- start:184 stop:471 length:288 start_codon:yes stop_codon:yes gene_type:complete
MFDRDQPVGVIEVVHLNSWDMDIGWIMDISLIPEKQGIGLGKHLLQESLHQLYKAGYKNAGLGVTLSNKNAHQLYLKMGFVEYEYFAEIIGNSSP